MCVNLDSAMANLCLRSDPYKSTENYRTVFVEVDGDNEENMDPKPMREAEENMQVVLVSLDDLQGSLRQLVALTGCSLESKLLSFAQGQCFGNLVGR